ncbi:MAG: type II toxin-antitoxin system RelB/DinJ family antitoxin [Clostridia bacterium]|nr:type II toxin-antitoxin system RelB/DinJ family antitoxin [Clostridia bacterium]
MAKVSTNITIDAETKARAQALLADLGLDLSTAVNIFLRQMVYENAIPFEIRRAAADAPKSQGGEPIS